MLKGSALRLKHSDLGLNSNQSAAFSFWNHRMSIWGFEHNVFALEMYLKLTI